jgi:predicted acyltransferase
MSLDLFRGATIAGMILVNNAGDEPSSYWPLKHAQWNGWTPTDLVFPFFLFIVGVAMPFSFSARLKRGESKRELLRHVLWRGVVLFALGMFLNGFPDQYHLASWRVYGVLQRIAVCYVISAILALWADWRGWIVTIAGCLVGYWLLMRFVPVPGFGVPTHDIPLLDPDRNLAAWLDRRLLAGHLYERTRDPEGVLSTIPAVATSLLGILTGQWLRSARSLQSKAAGMALFGVIGVVAGTNSGPRVPHQQKTLDEFLRDLYRRSGSARSGAVLLDGRRQEMAWPLDEATAGVWNECHCRLCVCRSDIRLARSPPHGRRYELAGIYLRKHVRAAS